ncbi:penicillin-binding transpeptidase domain-containing protein [Streptomyces sp. NRRL F-5630]|uniref:peptidoglycan D,D-transpeptidase FtsI family protein n=1 Tax=Streptomyces sp. NRRL F-5630 TaxID=1463864 RepID=UPI003EB87A0D
MTDREPPRRRVPGPARPAERPRAGARPGPRPGPGARPRRSPSGPGPRLQGPRTIRLGSPRPRLRLVGFTITLIMAVFVVRLLQIQAVDADSFTTAAQKNRVVVREIAPERGAVTDRNGVELATSVDAYDITADPSMFSREQTHVKDAPEQAAALLAPILGKDEDKVAAQLRGTGRYALLATRQTPQVWTQIKDLKNAFQERATKDRPSILAGIFQEPTSKRVYPNGDLAAGILGWVNSEGKGAGGLEAQYETSLAGTPGEVRYAQAGGRQVPTAGGSEHPAVAGTDVQLTLNRDIQWAAQQAITEQVKKSEADRGYVVVQDTRTGEILALANAPGFDPNDLSHADMDALGNPALQDAYEPGSTSKIMSMAAVLEENKATPGTHVTVPGELRRGDRVFHDDVAHGTWHLTLNGVLAKSSNIGTILATGQLGRTQEQANRVLYSYLHKFGIGSPTGLGFPGETSGILAPPDKWNTSQQYTIPFGQGLSINAVQAASVYSTIANGGVRTAPTLVRATRGPDGRWAPTDPAKKNRVVSDKTAKTLAAMLESVVDDKEGTGTSARIPGYRVAGKTGTANRVDPKTGLYRGYTASFAGFAPADKPRVTVYCAIQNPTKGGYFGGQICGPIYKSVMEFALKTLQVPPTGAAPARLPTTFEP